MTAQEIYDKVCAHLAQQKVRAYVRKDGIVPGRCVYKGEDGKMCAVGCLINFDAFPEAASFDGDVQELLDEYFLADNEPNFLPEDFSTEQGVDFLGYLQVVHDTMVPSDLQRLYDHLFGEPEGSRPNYVTSNSKRLQQALATVATHYGLQTGAEQQITQWDQ